MLQVFFPLQTFLFAGSNPLNIVLLIVIAIFFILLINTFLAKKQLQNKVVRLQEKNSHLLQSSGDLQKLIEELQLEKKELISESKKIEKEIESYQQVGSQFGQFLLNNHVNLGLVPGLNHEAKMMLLNIGLMHNLENSGQVYSSSETSLKKLLNQIVNCWWPDINQLKVDVSEVNITDTVMIDEQLLASCLVNLLDNALKYSAENETITVAAEQSDGYINVTIKNRGKLAKKHHSTLFNKYIKLQDDKNNGAGIGLYVCKLAIESMGGTIGVHARPDDIAEFWIQLPDNKRG